ncbi:hypothetical protein FSP39_009777 [Pinctada imbricata]|uniref:RING-type domain-containing protein n=1 Tax=Pinctada imbricata TaxID=66713 RepID=A0AA89C101_PINIB|nr:hypothetical protein FSP39_009777 [Pinctada imbricata]
MATKHARQDGAKKKVVPPKSKAVAADFKKIDITKCPVCKNTLETPKELTCLHAFCEHCLIKRIERAKSKSDNRTFRFRCPECHELQGIYNAAEYSDNIARAFPTSHLISSLLSSASSPNCKPCSKVRKTTKGTYWCKYCADALCDDHYEYHREVTSKEVHQVCRIEDMRTSSDHAYAPAVCTDHPSELYTIFCKDHKVCICDEGRKLKHKYCNKVSINEEADRLKKGSNIKTVMGKLQSTNAQAEIIAQDLNENIDELTEKKRNCSQTIKDIREHADLHFNMLEKKLLSSLFKMFNEKTKQMKTEISSFEVKGKTIQYYKSLLGRIFETGTDIQLIYELPIVSRAIGVISEKVTHRAARIQTVEIRITFNDVIRNLPSLGRFVETEEYINRVSPTQISPENSPRRRKVKVDLTPKLPSIRMSMNNFGFLAIRYQSSKITGGTSLNGSVLVADYTCKEIRAYQSDSARNDALTFTNLKGNPWDLAILPLNATRGFLVFTLPHVSKFIAIQSPHTEQINAPIEQIHYTTSLPSYGVSCAEGLLIFACLRCLEIWRLDSFTEPMFDTRISTDGENVQYVHVVNAGRVYYTDSTERGGLYCVTLDHTVVFKYNNRQLKRPRGITVDINGNAYVAGYTSNNIHKISPDGDLIQIIVPRITSFVSPITVIECDGIIYCVYGKHKITPIN